MKIRIQDGAIYIAPEDDEERQACEIAVNALLRWSAEHDKEKRNSNEKQRRRHRHRRAQQTHRQ